MNTEILKYGVPVLLVGAPGIGKTETVKQSFDFTEVILASAMVEEDIAGIPYREGDAIERRTMPVSLRRLHEADKAGKTTCLFLDELDKARRSVADTLLTLVQSRRIGDNALPANTAIIAAANPPEFSGGDGISQAMLNRFSVVEMEPNIATWSEYQRPLVKSESSERVFRAVCDGRIPLCDVAGEGLNFRMTSPRSLTNALRVMDLGGNEESVLTILKGLLTPTTATAVIRYMGNIAPRKVERRCDAVVKKHTPVRI